MVLKDFEEKKQRVNSSSSSNEEEMKEYMGKTRLQPIVQTNRGSMHTFSTVNIASSLSKHSEKSK